MTMGYHSSGRSQHQEWLILDNQHVGNSVDAEKIVSFTYLCISSYLHTSVAVEADVWCNNTIRKHTAMKEATIIMLEKNVNRLTSLLFKLKVRAAIYPFISWSVLLQANTQQTELLLQNFAFWSHMWCVVL